MERVLGININSESRIPKYQQIIDSVIKDIENGHLKVGQKIPSINEISEEYYLSRDTVEKAYNQLKERKIIVSAKGKGYYVARTDLVSHLNVLFLMNKLSSYKMKIYNSFVNSLGPDVHVDLHIYHCDARLFVQALEENVGAYDYYVIMPHFKDEQQNHVNATSATLSALQKVPREKLIFLDNLMPGLEGDFSAIYQDFKMDIYEALTEAKERLKHYGKLILVYPRKLLYPYPVEIVHGFRMFCNEYSFDFEVLDEIYPDMELHSGDAYIIIEEADLVSLIKQSRDKGLALGKDIGVVSYNDTPLKDLLGITVISTDFKVMGETAAYMVEKKKRDQVKNIFSFVNRNSI